MLLTLATSALAGSCKKSKFEGFDETDSGLSYKFFIQKDGQKPKEGDVITLKLKYFNEKDSLLFDSKSIGRPFMVQVPKPSFKGSFEEGFTMMSLGDSVAFMNSADSFFTKIVHGDLPPQIKKGSFLKHLIRTCDYFFNFLIKTCTIYQCRNRFIMVVIMMCINN